MAYVDPSVQERMETLSPELQEAILKRNIPLNNIHDLIHCLEAIVAEDEG